MKKLRTNSKKIKFCILIFQFLLCGLCLSSTLLAEQVAKIIAKINNQIITSKDLEDYCKVLQLKLTDTRDLNSSEDGEFRKMALERLIEDQLILDQAERANIEIPPAAIDGRLNEIIASHSSVELFEQSLKKRGFTITSLKEKIRQQYLMRQFIEMQVKSSIRISPQEISDYYRDNKDKILSAPGYIFYIATSKERSHLTDIFRKIKAEGIETALSLYADELIRLESVEAELRPEIAKSLKQLKVGSCKITTIDDLIYLVYLEEEVKPRMLTLPEAQEAIYDYLWNNKFKVQFTAWISDLKEKAVIKIYEQ